MASGRGGQKTEPINKDYLYCLKNLQSFSGVLSDPTNPSNFNGRDECPSLRSHVILSPLPFVIKHLVSLLDDRDNFSFSLIFFIILPFSSFLPLFSDSPDQWVNIKEIKNVLPALIEFHSNPVHQLPPNCWRPLDFNVMKKLHSLFDERTVNDLLLKGISSSSSKKLVTPFRDCWEVLLQRQDPLGLFFSNLLFLKL